MSFSITNNSANAVVSDISTPSSTYGTFTISSGSFPLLSGQTISGTNTAISNLKGSQYGTIQIFLQQGDAQIELYVNGSLYSANDYSSGIASVQCPPLSAGDTIAINIDEADLPVPSPTPSVTPSSTPSVTPTPSPTPVVVDPNTLNALWWIDYSDPAYVSLNGGNVAGVTNRTGAPSFSASSGNEPTYFSTAFNGVSGATSTSFGMFSLSGDYITNITEYTTFFFFSAGTGDNAVLNGSDFITDYSGNSQAYRWYSVDDYGGGDFIRTYTFFTGGTSTSPEPQIDFTPNQWSVGATRVYQSGTSAVTEVFLSGILTGQTINAGQDIITAADPIFQVGGSGGDGFKIAEAFFFDYKLSDSQMTQMYNYLNNKY